MCGNKKYLTRITYFHNNMAVSSFKKNVIPKNISPSKTIFLTQDSNNLMECHKIGKIAENSFKFN